MTHANRQRIDYLRWSLSRIATADTTCPACGSASTRVVDRKYLVTSLLECLSCRLRFRIPKEEPGEANNFYQDTYREGMTTQMPPDDILKLFMLNKFIGTEKNFAPYIDVCLAAGLQPGARILDFGCSWGYGSWQFRQAGFEVFSSEISRPRREYARTKLDCRMLENPASVAGTIDCFFSAHVIEHLPDPGILFAMAQSAITNSGIIVTFCPNGDPQSEWSDHYSDLWGRKHPLVITPAFIEQAAAKYGLTARMYSNPYDLNAISTRAKSGRLPGDELCIIMRKPGH